MIIQKNITISILVLFSLFVSCNFNTNDVITEPHIDNTLQLDNGKKWKATGSMTHYMTNMNTIVNTVDLQTFDPKKIGYKLNLELRMMLSMCTATGDAHDQFHNYLDPLKAQVNGLRLANEIAKAPLLISIKTHLKNYNNYFN